MITKEELEVLEPLVHTRPMFGIFAVGDGSGWFCSYCAQRAPMGPDIVHKSDCRERGHWRALEFLKQAAVDLG